MKSTILRLVLTFLGLSAIYIYTPFAQQECEVGLEAISGMYDGECRKGQAHGKGKAVGTDAYEGEFRKGLPHGIGVYTWSNGAIFKGEFKNGAKSGEGQLFMAGLNQPDSVLTGFWEDDEYVGKFKTPYEVLAHSGKVTSVRISESDGESNTLFVTILHKGRTEPNPDFSIRETAGNYMNIRKTGRTTNILVGNFPFSFTLNYRGERVDIEIRRPGSYDIMIDLSIT
jgi:hypothetical protein